MAVGAIVVRAAAAVVVAVAVGIAFPVAVGRCAMMPAVTGSRSGSRLATRYASDWRQRGRRRSHTDAQWRSHSWGIYAPRQPLPRPLSALPR